MPPEVPPRIMFSISSADSLRKSGLPFNAAPAPRPLRRARDRRRSWFRMSVLPQWLLLGMGLEDMANATRLAAKATTLTLFIAIQS